MKARILKKMSAVCSAIVMLLGMRKFKINRGKFANLLVLSLLMNFVLIMNAPVAFAADPEILINYNFDDNVLDSSGKGNDGTIHGPVSFVDGYHGKAIDLTGGNGYVSLPANMILNNESFTVSMRFKTTGKGGLFGYQNTQVGTVSTQYVPILCVRSDGKLYAEMWTGDSMTVLSDNAVNDGQWHRVVMTSGTNSIRVYLDGNDIGGATGIPKHLSMSISQIGTNAAWGRPTETTITGNWNYFDGYIDDFLFYPVAQTSDEVSKTDQAISFAEIPNKKTDDSSFDLSATASSGLTVTFSSSNTDVATVSGNTVTIKGAGTTDITANQAGNDTYSAAPPVTRTLTVEPTAAELANASIATAKGLIPTSFTATEGTDTNLLTHLNGISGISDTGVTLTLVSSNGNVADGGTITYGSSAVTGDVVVHINKADGTEDTKSIAVTVPVHALTDAEAVAGAKTDLDSSDLTFGGSDTAAAITQNFTLPLTGSNGTTISWAEKTDAGNNISLSVATATVTRPAYGQRDKTVTLTATITKNEETETKDITVIIKETAPTAAELANASIATAKGLIPASFTATEGTDTNLLTYLNGISGISDTGVTLTLVSSNGNVADGGTITYGSSAVTGDVVVHINKADGTEDTKTISVTVPVHALTDTEAVAGAKTDLDSSDLTFAGSDTATAVTQSFTLPLTGSNGTTISWAEKTDAGNNISLSVATATVTRPAYGQRDKTVTLTATITKNEETETKDITVIIKETAPTAAELANASIATAKGLIPASFTATEGTDTNLLTYLNGISGISDTGVTLTLVSSNGNVADGGTITYGSVAVTDNVVVHINKADGTEDTKSIAVTVPVHALTDAEAVAGAKTDLDSSDLTFGGSDTAAAITQNFTLPLTGSNGTTISWAEKTDAGNNISLSVATATVTRPAYGQRDKTVTLTATITKNEETETKDITVIIKETAPTAAELANASIATAKGLIPASFTATEGTDTNLLTYLNGISGISDTGVTLTLVSSNGNVADGGTITYGSVAVTDNVVVHINKADGTEDTKSIAVTVPVHALTDAEAVAGAKTDLDSSDLTFGGSDTAAAITQNFTLPLTGSNGTTISWAEKTDAGNNISLSVATATVTRPAYGQGNKTVTLTATITKNGETETKDITVTIKEAARRNSSSSSSPNTVQKTLDKAVEVDGQKYDVGISKTNTVENKSVTTIIVDGSKLDKILADCSDKPTVALPATEDADEVVGKLNGQTVKNMEAKNAVLEIRTGTSSYSLPAAQINIDAVAADIGKKVELKDIEVNVSISEPPADMVKIVENNAAKNSYQIVVKPVEFAITCSSGDKTVEVSKFNGYVERRIAIPDGINPSKITTGVVLNSDGTFRHVPTQIEVIDGKYFAKINSLTNSTYSVIYNLVELADVENHWAKASVNDMASRMVVSSDETGCYHPNKNITRAEFTTIIVRALGLAQETKESNFSDVSKNDWFNGYVMTATEYGLIQGYDQSSFGPNDLITREQAMTILNRAMKLTGLEAPLSDTEKSNLLTKYKDLADISNYANDSTAACIKTEIVTERNGNLIAPKGNITRAEAAVIAQRLLQKSGLI